MRPKRKRPRRGAVAAASIASALVLASCGGASTTGSTGTRSPAPGSSTTGGAATSTPASTTGSAGTPPNPSGAGSSKLALSADPSGQLRFTTSTLDAHAGAVTIDMHNPSQLSHSIAIEGSGVNTAGQVVGPEGTSTVSATLKPGTYKFFCTVPGHRQAGMEGTLTVK